MADLAVQRVPAKAARSQLCRHELLELSYRYVSRCNPCVLQLVISRCWNGGAQPNNLLALARPLYYRFYQHYRASTRISEGQFGVYRNLGLPSATLQLFGRFVLLQHPSCGYRAVWKHHNPAHDDFRVLYQDVLGLPRTETKIWGL